MNRFGIKKIISGGQTGADRGGLDAAIELGIQHGGWCPLGRLAEDGRVPLAYKLKEHSAATYPPRTALNIHDADVTLIFKRGQLGHGSRLTLVMAQGQKKKHLVLDIDAFDASVLSLGGFLVLAKPKVLNVAGSRESHQPGMQDTVRRILVTVIGN
jgi:Circularly permutated YpsA SLOG family